MTCGRAWEARAIDESRLAEVDIASFRRHTRTCDECRKALLAMEDLRALSRELPSREPGELQLRRLRARLLRDAMSTKAAARPRALLAALVGLAAAILVATTLLRRGTPKEAFAATVVTSEDAAWTQTRAGSIERIVLTRGSLWLRVRHQTPSERVLVVVPDGEIEVRGTTFDVRVDDQSRTARVHVDDGVVSVRIGHDEATVRAGETWPPRKPAGLDRAPVVSLAPTSSSAVVAPNGRQPEPPDTSSIQSPRSPPWRQSAASHVSPGPSADPDSREAADYALAIDTYRLGRFEQAADLLHAFAMAYPRSALVDDASFLEASSLASAGRADAAALLAERHLVRFPDSFHRKGAAILIARVRRDRGNCDGARTVLAPWLRAASSDREVLDVLGSCNAAPSSPSASAAK
jgi:TolA-binding protein